MSSRWISCVLFILALSLLPCMTGWADEPALVWSTFLGGSSDDFGDGDLALDCDGHLYIVGSTHLATFPTTPGAFDTTNAYDDAFVVKLDATGSVLVYATFLGGLNTESGYGIAADSAGNAYVTGLTDSYDFPATPGAFDTTLNDSPEHPWPYFDAFVTKLDPTGSSLVYSTFLGGTEVDDVGNDIFVDHSGDVYVVGNSGGADFPVTAGAFDTTYNGGVWAGDAFVAKLNASGSDLEYATYLGGIDQDAANSIAVDNSGNAHVSGATTSPNFPSTAGAHDETFNGSWDAFVVKLNPSGSALEYATFLGGGSQEEGWGIALNDIGDAYLTGYTTSLDFPTTSGAYNTSPPGGEDAFVAKIGPMGGTLAYASFLGGSGDDDGWDLLLDEFDNIYVTGQTLSSDFPVTPGAYDESFNGMMDAFVSKLSPTGDVLLYSTYLGGYDFDWSSKGVGLDGSGKLCFTGGTSSTDFPTTPGVFDETHNGGYDAFVAKLDLSGVTVPVVMAGFEATGHQDFVALQWMTVSEVNCHRWDIYRSDREDGEYNKVGELSGHGCTEMPHTYRWVDGQVSPGVTYFYKLRQVNFDGSAWWSHVVSAAAGSGVPRIYALHQNFPNPFNAYTEIGYRLAEDDHVTLKVFNSLGQEVRTLIDQSQVAGEYSVAWDGRDVEGREVASGLYFCHLGAGDFCKVVKMALVR